MKTFNNATFYVMDGQIKDTLYVNDEGMIIDAPDDTPNEIIDLQGGFVYPAFVDCHLHLMGYGQHLSRLSVHHLTKKEDILSYIQLHLSAPYTYIEGYHPCGITKDDLTRISPHIKIYLRHADYHGMTVNEATLQYLNINSDTGILLENEGTLALQSIEKPSQDTLQSYLKKAYESLWSFGVIGGHSDDLYYFNGYQKTKEAFMHVSKTHPFYSHLLIHHETLDDYVTSGDPHGRQNDYVELGAVKMFYDGTTGSLTALMEHPYIDDTYGMRVNDIDQFKNYVRKARKYDLNVAVHVIGDQGLKEVSDILKEIPPTQGFDRIIHACYASLSALENVKDIPVFLDVQPQFLTTDYPHTLSYFKEAPAYQFPFQTYDKLGIKYGLSSDAPVEIPNPILGMYAAIFREVNGTVYQPNERLTRDQAIRGYTTTPWILTGEKAGLLKVGYPCHLTVLQYDLYTIEKSDFKQNQVTHTYLKGTCLYTHKKT